MYDENDEPTHDFWDARRIERSFLPAPTPFRPGQPGYMNTHVPRRYRIVGPPLDSVTVRVRMRPIGLEVLRELVVSGDLDPEVVSRMPTYTLAGSVLEWSPATADLRTSPLTGLMVLSRGLEDSGYLVAAGRWQMATLVASRRRKPLRPSRPLCVARRHASFVHFVPFNLFCHICSGTFALLF